ncbi:type III pantothenate kinase [Spiroplasma endosymbiont of Amphibalanus improvisus]|uniref:type III pantothenate kinase n=1 Tax=Spiroplasma endosymbiont of Amphibalanus improvisus TaxID=3066327 RepID=UPI00313D4259
MYLLIHLGFDSIQFGLCKDGELVEKYSHPLNNVRESEFKSFVMKNKNKIEQIYALVIDSIFSNLIDFSEKELGLKAKRISKDNIKIGLDSNLDLDLVDSDVLLSFWMAAPRNEDLIIVFIDNLVRVFLFSKNKIQGCAVFLSADLQIKSLVKNISRIDYFDKTEYSETLVGKNRNEAISIGIYHNQASMLNEIVSQYQLVNKKDPKVLFIGEPIDELIDKKLKFKYLSNQFYVLFAIKNFAVMDNKK